jgi:hypothetical protein
VCEDTNKGKLEMKAHQKKLFIKKVKKKFLKNPSAKGQLLHDFATHTDI